MGQPTLAQESSQHYADYIACVDGRRLQVLNQVGAGRSESYVGIEWTGSVRWHGNPMGQDSIAQR